jgi:hypothetical protein
MERSEEIESIVHRVFEAIGSGDSGAVDGMVSRHPEVLLIGTDPSEWWSGHETISNILREQLKEMQDIGIELTDVRAYTEDGIGWASARARYEMPDGLGNEVRFTAVFRREDGDWRLVQGHSSIGVPNDQAFGMTMPM